MIGKKFLHKRGVMIALAVIVLTTLTAGTAAAHANSVKFTAKGSVGLVTLLPFESSVGSDFALKNNGKIKKVTITTVGEVVAGSIDSVNCKKHGKKNHDGSLCTTLQGLLAPSSVFSAHGSTAVLKVSKQEHPYSEALPIPVVSGRLKGSLVGQLDIIGGDYFTGLASLKIKSARGKSHYGCLLGINPLTEGTEWGSIGVCQDDPGPNVLSLFLPGAGYVVPNPDYDPETDPPELALILNPDPLAGPVMVPVELHVTDTGTFDVTGTSGVNLTGRIKVKVDSDPSGTTGTIKVTKGNATFPAAP